MQINVLATGAAPDYYTFNGETITAHHEGVSEVYDLSDFPEGGTFTGAGQVNGVTALRHVERTGGELKVKLCQQVGAGHWQESGWVDAASYDPDAINVKQGGSKAYSGTAWAKTRLGRAEGQ